MFQGFVCLDLLIWWFCCLVYCVGGMDLRGLSFGFGLVGLGLYRFVVLILSVCGSGVWRFCILVCWLCVWSVEWVCV